MRRFLLVVLLLVLSLQSVWTAAANACAHEQTTGSKAHFGHHEQHHETSQRDAPLDDSRGSPAEADHHHFLSGTPLPHAPVLATVVADAGTVAIHAVERYPGISIAALERPPKNLTEISSARSGWRRMTHSL